MRLGGMFVYGPLPADASSELFLQLLSLNLSNNKLYRLDDMSSIVQKAPKLKILNLCGNEVRTESCVCFVWGEQRVTRTCLVVASGEGRN